MNFLTIYIVEAHGQDEWPVGDPLKINQANSIGERCGVARQFVHQYEYPIPLLVDTMDNDFSTHYSAWPIRFYVLDPHRKVLYKAQPDKKNTYDSSLPELREWIREWIKS